MEAQQSGRGGYVPNSIWDDLAQEHILEPTEALEIKRGFFKRVFGTLYERLGTLLLLNVAVSVQLGIGAAIGLLLAVTFRATGVATLVFLGFGITLLTAPALAGLFTYVRAICDDDALPALADYWRGMRKYAVRSWLLAFAQVGAGALLVLNLRFYASIHSGIALAVIFVMLLLLLLWAMAGLYAWPLLVRDLSWGLLVRNSALLALAAPFSTIAILVVLSALSAVLIAIRIGWLLLLFVAWAVTENVALQRLVRIFRERQQSSTTPEPTEVADPSI